MRLLAAAAAATLVALAAPGLAAAQAPDPFTTLADNGVSSVVTAVPFNNYEPTTLYVSRSLGLHFNLDTAWHDVVALDAPRPMDSAPWCVHFLPDPDTGASTCPLFWTPLIAPGGSDPQGVAARKHDTQVQGLQDAQVGSTYRFICSIHPNMVGTIEVVA